MIRSLSLEEILMTYFQLEIDPKEHFVARAISHARSALRRAFLEAKEERHITQADLARCLGIDRSAINRQLTGEANLTVRSLAEMAWALNRELAIDLPKPMPAGGNEPIVSMNTSSGTVTPPMVIAGFARKDFTSTPG